jgi:transcriptional regulator with XRE-family HTH domain
MNDYLIGARKAKGMNQEQLAKLVGVSQTAISQIESGSRRTKSLISKIEKALGVSNDGDANKRQIEILRINNNIVSMGLPDLVLIRQLTQRMK